GGERNRLALAKMMLRPRNLLALDEPTNHLDIPGREVLEEALADYAGTILVVSHDRFFLDQIVTKILYIHDGKAELHTGNYSEWRERSSHQLKPEQKKPEAKPEQKKPEPKEAKKAEPEKQKRVEEHAERKAASRDLEKKKRRMAELEEKIS